ncbi:ArsR/SmtB family transcription factor [Paenibacillus mendelii]|uniref:ArsR/SmtB family transcription factor n=1 Tax=Paenibacillus mendelii TaxID=206163 RepID=A0ABV6JKW8_9BACL|nr:metalloregulator ArsR/SmtB family transcription factor [Paenibacillus mendelii]MCQ6560600.1 metalloregulator ArsR/SmtB family transcription factor [Paenibacillus mendelii]
MAEYKIELLNKVFHALADPTRREMVKQLAYENRTVTELASPFRISLAAASKHIKVLEEAGLLQRSVQGRTHICRLDPQSLAAANEWIRFYESFWSNQLAALERELDEAEPTELGMVKEEHND